MYTLIILLLLFILPIGSAMLELSRNSAHYLPALLLKWFVFWGVGIRLLVAGASQVTNPGRTASILGLTHQDALFPIRELGFANIAMGVLGTVSLWLWQWRFPGAIVGVVFYGLAGVNHVISGKGTTSEKLAMITDLGFAAVMAVLAFLAWRHS